LSEREILAHARRRVAAANGLGEEVDGAVGFARKRERQPDVGGECRLCREAFERGERFAALSAGERRKRAAEACTVVGAIHCRDVGVGVRRRLIAPGGEIGLGERGTCLGVLGVGGDGQLRETDCSDRISCGARGFGLLDEDNRRLRFGRGRFADSGIQLGDRAARLARCQRDSKRYSARRQPQHRRPVRLHVRPLHTN